MNWKECGTVHREQFAEVRLQMAILDILPETRPKFTVRGGNPRVNPKQLPW